MIGPRDWAAPFFSSTSVSRANYIARGRFVGSLSVCVCLYLSLKVDANYIARGRFVGSLCLSVFLYLFLKLDVFSWDIPPPPPTPRSLCRYIFSLSLSLSLYVCVYNIYMHIFSA